MRLVFAAIMPLAADEAYYWLWSKHLAGGYYDHPPAVALVIRAGTLIAGDTELGVRLVSVLAGAANDMGGVSRCRDPLQPTRRGVGGDLAQPDIDGRRRHTLMSVTPDAPLIVASAFVLYYLAKVLETGEGRWWLRGRRSRRRRAARRNTPRCSLGVSILLWLALSAQPAALVSPDAVALSRRLSWHSPYSHRSSSGTRSTAGCR